METKINPDDVLRLEFQAEREVEDVSSRPIESGIGLFMIEPASYTAVTSQGTFRISRKQFKRLSKKLN